MQPFSLSFPLTSKRRRRSFRFMLVFSLYVAAESYFADAFSLCSVHRAFASALTVFCVFGCSPAYISVVIALLRRSVGRSVF